MVVRLKEWLSLRRGFDDIVRHGSIVGFVLRLLCLTVILSLLCLLVSFPVFRAFGFEEVPLVRAMVIAVLMCWFVTGSTSLIIGVGLASEVRSMAVSRAKYEHLSRVDGLSGLLNRRAFAEALELCQQAFVAASNTEETYGGKRATYQAPPPASLAILDLDRFKAINDRYGHTAGDAVIRAVSDILERVAGRTHICGRLGGEEFGLILRGGSPADRQAIVEEVRLAVANLPLTYEGERIVTTLSAGIAEISAKRTVDDCYAAADRILYRAKEAGRNCVMREEDGPQAEPLKYVGSVTLAGQEIYNTSAFETNVEAGFSSGSA